MVNKKPVKYIFTLLFATFAALTLTVVFWMASNRKRQSKLWATPQKVFSSKEWLEFGTGDLTVSNPRAAMKDSVLKTFGKQDTVQRILHELGTPDRVKGIATDTIQPRETMTEYVYIQLEYDYGISYDGIAKYLEFSIDRNGKLTRCSDQVQ